jgi:hypothetical protein
MLSNVLGVGFTGRGCDCIDREITCKMQVEPGESERHLVSAWQARLEHSRVKAFAINNICNSNNYLTYFTSFTHLASLHIDPNGSRRTAIRAAITHSRRSQLCSRHCRRPLSQLFVRPEPYRSTWLGAFPGVDR